MALPELTLRGRARPLAPSQHSSVRSVSPWYVCGSVKEHDPHAARVPEKPFKDRVFAVVKRIPRGRVASYGLVAELAGSPRAARQVGLVMRLSQGLPWWRVLAKDGRIVIQNPEYRFAQHAKLESEGIPVREGRVDYERFAWRARKAR